LEYILLRSALYDLPPINLKEYKICDVHYNHLITRTRRDFCKTCKTIFGRKSCSTFHLSRISRTIAYGIWQDYQLSLFDQFMCGGCRKKLEKKYVTKDLYEKTEALFSWLYDDFTLYTPSTISSSSHSMYNHNEEEEIKLDKKQDFKKFLLNNGFNGRVQMTNNYHQMKYKSQQNFLRQIIAILLFILELLVPNDFLQVWNDIIELHIQETKQEYKLNGKFGTVMNCIADAYNNASHWSIRRQVLSIVASDVPAFVIEQFIPDITQWKIKAAREQAYTNG
jgi:hypothetical protein